MIVLNLTLQFLPVEQREKLLTACYNALAEGGILILTEKTHLLDEADDAWRVERYYDFFKPCQWLQRAWRLAASAMR